jgi:hypothetical protein
MTYICTAERCDNKFKFKEVKKKKEYKLLYKNVFRSKLLCATVLYYSCKNVTSFNNRNPLIKPRIQSAADQQDRNCLFSCPCYPSEIHGLHSNFLIVFLCLSILVASRSNAANTCKPVISRSLQTD